MHVVCEPREFYPVPTCEGNPAQLDCPACKGFKHSGICSHVLAVNHILKQFNVRYQLLPIGKRTDKKNKGGEKRTPALTRIQQCEAFGDRSDRPPVNDPSPQGPPSFQLRARRTNQAHVRGRRCTMPPDRDDILLKARRLRLGHHVGQPWHIAHRAQPGR